jgi:methylenetetrahydrofolate reductase (NADPH)
LAVADDPRPSEEVGVALAVELSERMLAEGAPGLHFITMNRSTATLEVYEHLSL